MKLYNNSHIDDLIIDIDKAFEVLKNQQVIREIEQPLNNPPLTVASISCKQLGFRLDEQLSLSTFQAQEDCVGDVDYRIIDGAIVATVVSYFAPNLGR